MPENAGGNATAITSIEILFMSPPMPHNSATPRNNCRRQNQAEERVPDGFPTEREFHRGKREARGKHGHTGIRFGDQIEVGATWLGT